MRSWIAQLLMLTAVLGGHSAMKTVCRMLR